MSGEDQQQFGLLRGFIPRHKQPPSPLPQLTPSMVEMPPLFAQGIHPVSTRTRPGVSARLALPVPQSTPCTPVRVCPLLQGQSCCSAHPPTGLLPAEHQVQDAPPETQQRMGTLQGLCAARSMGAAGKSRHRDTGGGLGQRVQALVGQGAGSTVQTCREAPALPCFKLRRGQSLAWARGRDQSHSEQEQRRVWAPSSLVAEPSPQPDPAGGPAASP